LREEAATRVHPEILRQGNGKSIERANLYRASGTLSGGQSSKAIDPSPRFIVRVDALYQSKSDVPLTP
jgi:hypothetical protein